MDDNINNISTTDPQTNLTPPDDGKPRYPRSGWLLLVRSLLFLFGVIAGPLYIWVLCQAILKHTLHTVDHDLLTAPSIIETLLLTAGGTWALVDMIREEIAASVKRKAERRVPFVVRAEQRWRKDLTNARAQGNRRAEGIALGNIGFWLNEQDRYAEAETFLTEALAIARSSGDRFHEERAMCDLAHCAYAHGDLDEVEALYRQALAVALKLSPESMPGAHPENMDVLDEVANLYVIVGRFLAQYRDNRAEGCQMLAEAAEHYREEADYYEMAAQTHQRGRRHRAFEDRMRQRALDFEQDARDLYRQYGGDDGDGDE